MGHGFGVGFHALLRAGCRSRGRVDELEAVRGEELVDRVLLFAQVVLVCAVFVLDVFCGIETDGEADFRIVAVQIVRESLDVVFVGLDGQSDNA